MHERELRDFIRAVHDFQRITGCTFVQAKSEVSRMLGVVTPMEGDGIVRLPTSQTSRRRGRGPSAAGLTRADAVAAVAVYFQSVGAGMEQSVITAQRWLDIKVPRQSARDAIARHKASTTPSQYKIQAQWSCAVQPEPNKTPLPDSVAKVRKRRQRAAINPSFI
jgi:hypothetical protein